MLKGEVHLYYNRRIWLVDFLLLYFAEILKLPFLLKKMLVFLCCLFANIYLSAVFENEYFLMFN